MLQAYSSRDPNCPNVHSSFRARFWTRILLLHLWPWWAQTNNSYFPLGNALLNSFQTCWSECISTESCGNDSLSQCCGLVHCLLWEAKVWVCTCCQLRIQGGPGGPGPLSPKISSKSCSFQAILRENSLFWANFGLRPPHPSGVKTLLAPPDQNPGSACITRDW